MSYNIQKEKSGKQSVSVVELDIKSCKLTFGVAPCTAVEEVPGSGTKCFDTFATCQDTDAYLEPANEAEVIKTYRFSTLRIDTLQQEGETPTFPTVLSADNAPARLTPGKGLGVRSSVKIKLQDHPWTDIGTDKYITEGERQYDADDQGTFWGKFLARNPFYENDVMRVKQGYLTDEGEYLEDNMVIREYILFRIAGPDKAGMVSIDGKDILKFSDAVKSKLPIASRARLTQTIDNSVTNFSFDDDLGQIFAGFNAVEPPNGVGKQEYIIIEDEVMKIDSIVDNTGGNYTVEVFRATLPDYYTEPVIAVIHEDETPIQSCFNFDNRRLDVILQILLEHGSGIDRDFLDLPGWDAVMEFGLNSYIFSTLLIEPISVKDLINEISEYTIFFWWHERDVLVKMDSLLLKRLSTPVLYNDEFEFLANTVSSTRDVKQRVSQAWLYFGHRSPLLDMDKLQYFNKLEVVVDQDSESTTQYETPAIKQIFSRWLTTNQDTIANEITSRLVNQYKDTKTIVQATVDGKDDRSKETEEEEGIWTGSLLRAQTQFVQDEFGAAENKTYLILEVQELDKPTGTQFKYLLQEWANPGGRFALIAPDEDPDNPGNPFPDYVDASDGLKQKYIFIAPDSGFFSDGTPAYQIL